MSPEEFVQTEMTRRGFERVDAQGPWVDPWSGVRFRHRKLVKWAKETLVQGEERARSKLRGEVDKVTGLNPRTAGSPGPGRDRHV